jgi:hypothetical protein
MLPPCSEWAGWTGGASVLSEPACLQVSRASQYSPVILLLNHLCCGSSDMEGGWGIHNGKQIHYQKCVHFVALWLYENHLNKTEMVELQNDRGIGSHVLISGTILVFPWRYQVRLWETISMASFHAITWARSLVHMKHCVTRLTESFCLTQESFYQMLQT